MRPLRTSLAAFFLIFSLAESALPQRRKRKALPKAVDTIYLPTDPGMIRYQPVVYEGRLLRVNDLFGKEVEPDRLSKAAIRKGYDPGVYYIFETSHETSEMRCYVSRKDKRDFDMAQGMAKDEKITLFGKLDWIQAGRIRVLHFKVHRIAREVQTPTPEVPRSNVEYWYPALTKRKRHSYGEART